jgi:hypothetical protein
LEGIATLGRLANDGKIFAIFKKGADGVPGGNCVQIVGDFIDRDLFPRASIVDQWEQIWITDVFENQDVGRSHNSSFAAMNIGQIDDIGFGFRHSHPGRIGAVVIVSSIRVLGRLNLDDKYWRFTTHEMIRSVGTAFSLASVDDLMLVQDPIF